MVTIMMMLMMIITDDIITGWHGRIIIYMWKSCSEELLSHNMMVMLIMTIWYDKNNDVTKYWTTFLWTATKNSILIIRIFIDVYSSSKMNHNCLQRFTEAAVLKTAVSAWMWSPRAKLIKIWIQCNFTMKVFGKNTIHIQVKICIDLRTDGKHIHIIKDSLAICKCCQNKPSAGSHEGILFIKTVLMFVALY